MKALKLDHQLAELVRTGKKTATWRIYDDKDISVNDRIELIDKVDPHNPGTWTSVGVAKVTLVVEKQLGAITAEDSDGHEAYQTPAKMLDDFRKYYGPQVTLETPVKMIHFVLQRGEKVNNVAKMASLSKELKLYADGGSRGNPGPSASGFVLLGMDNVLIMKSGVYLGVTTNNQAEYQALKFGLEEAQKLGAHSVHVYMDSLLVVNQMTGRFKVKNRDLWPIHESIGELVKQFTQVSFTHVPRELNKLADRAVNDALDEAERTEKQRAAREAS